MSIVTYLSHLFVFASNAKVEFLDFRHLMLMVAPARGQQVQEQVMSGSGTIVEFRGLCQVVVAIVILGAHQLLYVNPSV